jgi:hypothetical protein
MRGAIGQNGPRLDKLKHVPQCAARKPYSLRRHGNTEKKTSKAKPEAAEAVETTEASNSRVRENRRCVPRFQWIVIQCAARLSSVSGQRSALGRHEIAAADLGEFAILCERHRSLAAAAHYGLLFEHRMNEPRAQASGAFVLASPSSACPAGRHVHYREGRETHWAARKLVRASSARLDKLKLIPLESQGRGR